MQNEKPPETTPHPGQATSPQRWAAIKSCYGQNLIDSCSIIDSPPRLEDLKLAPGATPPQTDPRPPKSHPTPDQKAKTKSKRDRNCTPIYLGIPRAAHWTTPYAPHTHHIPPQTDTHTGRQAITPPKSSTKTAQVHSTIWMTLGTPAH